MTPFLYGMELHSVYDNGVMLSKEVASISPADVLKTFSSGVSNIVACSLELGLPVAPAVPHMVQNAFKNLLAISCETPYKLAALE
jgi:large subunit ribosomal protein LP0